MDMDVIPVSVLPKRGDTFCEGSASWSDFYSVPWICDFVEKNPNSLNVPDDASPIEDDCFFRLSGTPRELGDPLLMERDFVVAHTERGTNISSGRRLPLRGYLDSIKSELASLREDLSGLAGLSKPVVYCEAFKLLESDFSQILKSVCNLRENQKFVDDVKGCIWIAAEQHNWPITKPGWVNSIGFGVFAEAVLLMNTLDINKVKLKNENKVKQLTSWITDIFWSVLDEGISLLQEEADAEDVNIQNAILFLCNRENLLSTLREWTVSARLRGERNSSSHPFSKVASHDVRMAAIEYYNVILGQEFSERFRHVAQLGRLKLKKSFQSTALKDGGGDKIEDLFNTISDDIFEQ